MGLEALIKKWRPFDQIGPHHSSRHPSLLGVLNARERLHRQQQAVAAAELLASYVNALVYYKGNEQSAN